MSVESTLTKKIYQANSDTREWPVPFAYSRADDIRLMHTSADGIETPIVSNFRVNVNESGDTSVTYPLTGNPLPVGYKLTLYRETPQTQIVDLIYGGAFSPEVLEKDGFDRLEMQIQEVQEGVDRAIKYPLSSEESEQKGVDDIFNEIQDLVDKAEDAADRAERSANETYLESGVYNVRVAFEIPEEIPNGGRLSLPAPYYPGRAVFFLSYRGAICTPFGVGAENQYCYSEIGTDPNVATYEVILHFKALAGSVFDAWFVTSALGKNLDQMQEMLDAAILSAQEAAQAEQNALQSATAAAADSSTAADSAASAASSSQIALDAANSIVTAVPAHNADAAAHPTILNDIDVLNTRIDDLVDSGRPSIAPRVTVILASELPEGSVIISPPYTVGAKDLHVWYRGVYCEQANGEILEIGDPETKSTEFSFTFTAKAGSCVTMEVY